MFRKRRRVTPGFQIPPPFNPIDGNFADLQDDSVHPYCALFQVAAEDTYQNYVICRGFDPRTGKFIDYRDGDPNSPGVSVAKPYGARTVGTYSIGEIYPALLPAQWAGAVGGWVPPDVNWRLGQTPGEVVAGAVNGGHPADLLQAVQLMTDHKGELVNWMIIDGGKQADDRCENLKDIKPGTYRGIALEMISPASNTSGSVWLFDANNEAKQIMAQNYTECTFYLGDKIVITVDDQCTAFFTSCRCCGDGATGSPNCCDRSVAVCINGDLQVLAVNGGSYLWNVSELCGCELATLDVTIGCTPGTGDGVGEGPGPGGNSTITAFWTYDCDGVESSGTIDLSSLCTDEGDAEIIDQLSSLCNGKLLDRWANNVTECASVQDECCFCVTFSDMGGVPVTQGATAVTSLLLEASKSTICSGDEVTFDMTISFDAGGSQQTFVGLRPLIYFGCADQQLFNGCLPRSKVGYVNLLQSNPPHSAFFGLLTTGINDCILHDQASVHWDPVTINDGQSVMYSVTVRFEHMNPAIGTEIRGQAFFINQVFFPTLEAKLESTSHVPCGNVNPDPSEPGVDCCTLSRWFCVNGDSRQMSLSGSEEVWDVSSCCPSCTSATMTLRTTCNDGVSILSTIFNCDGVITQQALNLSTVCESTAPFVLTPSNSECTVPVTITLTEQACDSCDSCCDESRWFCINNVSKQISVSGGSDTFDVAACCDCTASVLTLTVSCDTQTNTIRVDWAMTCDALATVEGVEFLLCNDTVMNIVVNDCLYQIQVSTTNIGCAECSGVSPSPTPPPPP